jgi:phage gp36-like protein
VPDPVYVYATEADLDTFGLFKLSENDDIDPEEIPKAIETASDVANGYLSDGDGFPFTLPLYAPVPKSLTLYVSWIAAYLLMSTVGGSPESGGVDPYEDRYNKAIKWLAGVKAGDITLGDAEDSTPPDAVAASAIPFVISSTSRGYSDRGVAFGNGPDVIFDLPRRNGGGGFVGD